MARVYRKGRKIFCNRDQVEKLITNVPDDAMRLILSCGFHAGMRKREIIESRPPSTGIRAAARPPSSGSGTTRKKNTLHH